MSESPKAPILPQIRATLADLASKTDNPASLIALSRPYALQAVEEYAAEKGLAMTDLHRATLADQKLHPEVLIVLWGIPCFCADLANGLEMIGVWTWPGREAMKSLEESETFPALPWYSGLACSPEDMMLKTMKAHREADELMQRHPFPPVFRLIATKAENVATLPQSE